MSFLSAMANLQAVESPLKIKVGKNPEGVDQAAIDRAQKWIDKINAMFPNHPFMRQWKVMTWGEGDDQELGMFQLETDPVYDGVVHIAWFQAFPMRQGVGTKAMRRLQEMAKADGITLSLEPWGKGKIPKSALTKFYKGVGFKKDKGTDLMIWKPEEEVKGEIMAAKRKYDRSNRAPKRFEPILFEHNGKKYKVTKSTSYYFSQAYAPAGENTEVELWEIENDGCQNLIYTTHNPDRRLVIQKVKSGELPRKTDTPEIQNLISVFEEVIEDLKENENNLRPRYSMLYRMVYDSSSALALLKNGGLSPNAACKSFANLVSQLSETEFEDDNGKRWPDFDKLNAAMAPFMESKDVKATYEGPTQAVHPPVSMGHYPEPENLPVKRKGRRASTSSTTLWDDDMNDNEPLKDKELVMLVKEPGSIADDGAHNTRRDG